MEEKKKGEIAILIQVVLWGAFPVLTVGVYNILPPFLALSLSSLFAAAVFALVLSYKRSWREVFKGPAYKDILLMTAINGIGYYCLFFLALKYTTPGNASLVALFENLTNFLFFHIIRKEDFSYKEVFGYTLTAAGAFVILMSKFDRARYGDFLILVAACIAPVGNYYLRRARRMVSSESIMFIRNLISFLAVFFISLLFRENFKTVGNLGVQGWIFLLLNGGLVLGLSKLLWTEGIHRIPVSKALALGNMSPLFTLLLAGWVLGQKPSLYQLWSLPPLAIGIWLLLKNKENKSLSEIN